MPGKTSTSTHRASSKTRKPNQAKRAIATSKKVVDKPSRKKKPQSQPSSQKGKAATSKVSESVTVNGVVIEMEKVATLKGVINLPKRRRGRPTKEEEQLRMEILAKHGITGDPRIKRPRGRPRKNAIHSALSTHPVDHSP